MARLPRFMLPGQPQLIIQRGNNRQRIFNSQKDYDYFLEKLGESSSRHLCDIHSYVLMSNHIHLLITPQKETGMGQMMQTLGRYYVQFFNRNYSRTGTLWEGRYKATLIDAEVYLLTSMRYMELNPVRDNIVSHPSDYPFSSYRFNALGEKNPLIKPHRLYKRLGKNLSERQAGYRALFRSRIGQKTLDEIRSATNKSWVLGSRSFKQWVEKQLSRAVSPAQRGGDRKSEAYRKHQSKKIKK